MPHCSKPCQHSFAHRHSRQHACLLTLCTPVSMPAQHSCSALFLTLGNPANTLSHTQHSCPQHSFSTPSTRVNVPACSHRALLSTSLLLASLILLIQSKISCLQLHLHDPHMQGHSLMHTILAPYVLRNAHAQSLCLGLMQTSLCAAASQSTGQQVPCTPQI